MSEIQDQNDRSKSARTPASEAAAANESLCLDALNSLDEHSIKWAKGNAGSVFSTKPDMGLPAEQSDKGYLDIPKELREAPMFKEGPTDFKIHDKPIFGKSDHGFMPPQPYEYKPWYDSRPHDPSDRPPAPGEGDRNGSYSDRLNKWLADEGLTIDRVGLLLPPVDTKEFRDLQDKAKHPLKVGDSERPSLTDGANITDQKTGYSYKYSDGKLVRTDPKTGEPIKGATRNMGESLRESQISAALDAIERKMWLDLKQSGSDAGDKYG